MCLILLVSSSGPFSEDACSSQLLGSGSDESAPFRFGLVFTKLYPHLIAANTLEVPERLHLIPGDAKF